MYFDEDLQRIIPSPVDTKIASHHVITDTTMPDAPGPYTVMDGKIVVVDEEGSESLVEKVRIATRLDAIRKLGVVYDEIMGELSTEVRLRIERAYTNGVTTPLILQAVTYGVSVRMAYNSATQNIVVSEPPYSNIWFDNLPEKPDIIELVTELSQSGY